MRIVGGMWRGRALTAPSGQATRPTADRVRQALFDMLLHAPWGGSQVLDGARVLDAFAGTGALGLESLSRGAAFATFVEQDRAALAALRRNIAACRAEERTKVVAADVLAVARGEPCGMVFLDPPYGRNLVPLAVERLRAMGWLAPKALVVAETGRDEPLPELGDPLAERMHAAARITIFKAFSARR
ncbi:MAG TPA: 16S rRNA (guanine(966)-N(2))-methyltransferase RsmD [Acetobacteraceae bacterium]|jgi:16S rRNA (guanine966-N2)-methyltransferase|nr:16S rRNA (guanine(966)-N(2))-methyltransferase RsmD [Acetobacteraceae bacterium]